MMKVQSLADVKRMVADIASAVDDDEAAHGMEDELYDAILRYIANGGTEQIHEMAVVALTTKDLKFQRWCA